MGRPRKRRRDGEVLESLGLDALEQLPAATGFDLATTGPLYGFGEGQLSDLPVLNPTEDYSGTQFDPGLNSLDPILDQSLNNFIHDHENGPSNLICERTTNAALLETEHHLHAQGPTTDANPTQFYTNEYDNQDPSQAASLPSFPTPSSSGISSNSTGSCACLLEMTQTLSTLRSIPKYTFPESLVPIRKALQTTQSILRCPHCPKDSTTAMQNLMFLATLLTTVTDAYRTLLLSIDKEATRALSTDAKKHFRIGDSDPSKAHLHTGTEDCPLGFSIALAGSEWRMLARKVVEGDVLVPSSPLDPATTAHQSSRNGITVLGLAEQLEERQVRWHEGCVHEHFAGTDGERCVPKEGEEFHCLRMVQMVRSHVDMLELGAGD
ncbi:hypothetical protein FKW77_004512 [Venturia effusa]|uniref:Uncharacterized protein n=1 Tax=Venturia effusa TaxID=50376 RepID=A0A517LFH0_9PEZI|nr:hypothetical protein FKW77_004512 [Venturia effusa]